MAHNIHWKCHGCSKITKTLHSNIPKECKHCKCNYFKFIRVTKIRGENGTRNIKKNWELIEWPRKYVLNAEIQEELSVLTKTNMCVKNVEHIISYQK